MQFFLLDTSDEVVDSNIFKMKEAFQETKEGNKF